MMNNSGSGSLLMVEDCGDRTELIPPNLSTEEFLNLKAKHILPAFIATKIDHLFDEIIDDLTREKFNELMSNVIDIMLSYTPINFAEYHWYVLTTSCIMLLKNFPVELYTKQTKLILHTFMIENDLIIACPAKIHYVAKSLDELLKTRKNIVYFVRRIFHFNQFMHYVVTALLWTNMYQFIGTPIRLYRLMKIDNILNICALIDLSKIEDKLTEFYEFLLVFAAFLVVCRYKSNWTKFDYIVGLYDKQESSFANDSDASISDEKEIFKKLALWSEVVKNKVDSILTRRPSGKCLEIREIIEMEILMFLNVGDIE